MATEPEDHGCIDGILTIFFIAMIAFMIYEVAQHAEKQFKRIDNLEKRVTALESK